MRLSKELSDNFFWSEWSLFLEYLLIVTTKMSGLNGTEFLLFTIDFWLMFDFIRKADIVKATTIKTKKHRSFLTISLELVNR
jgi:hypothetical protein